MATDIMQPLRYVIDLQSGLVQTPMRSQLMKGDKKANRVIVELTDKGKAADLTGIAATGSFIRPPDADEILLEGIVDGNKVIVVLDDACYAQEGYCEIDVAIVANGVKRTILSLTGHVLSKGSGTYVDVSGVIPSIDDIIAQYAEMKRVTEATQEAADAATTAASKAPYVNPVSKNWMIWDAAAGMYVDSGMTAQGVQGPPGQNGTGSGTVTAVTVKGQKYEPDQTGNVDLGELGGGDASIDDTEPSADKTYSSEKIEEELNQLSQQMANKMQMDLLWENAIPNSNFVEHTVAVDFTQYDVIKIYWALSIGSNAYACAERPATAGRLIMQFVNVPDTGLTRNHRYATLAEDKKSIHFGIDIEGNTNADGIYIIPIRIYGVKGVGA